MPWPSPLVRRRGRRPAGWAGLLVIALLAVLGVAPAQSIAAVRALPATTGAATAAPSVLPGDPTAPPGPAALELVAIGPGALTPGGTLSAEVRVTNTTDQAIAEPVLELRAPTSRVTARTELRDWQGDTSAAADGAVRADSGPGAPPLGPGESRVMRLEVAADALGYSPAPELWGPRRLALTLRSGEAQLATLRTFTVWRPPSSTATVTESVLLPIAAGDPGAAVLDPAAHAASVESGELSGALRLAERPDVDWLLDPALLAPPPLARAADQGQPEVAPGEEPVGTDPADGGQTSAPAEGSASPAPDGAGQYAVPEAGGHLADRLRDASANRTVLALPYARADLLSLHAARTSELSDIIGRRGAEAFSAAGITPAGTVLEVPGPEADGAAVASARDSGADVVIAPSSSLREDPDGTITPSSIAELSDDGEDTPVLAPDPILSAQLATLSSGDGGAATTQRMLAETAVIAGEATEARRHVLIAPPSGTALDPEAAGTALDALGAAPWIVQGRTGDLLEAADSHDWTQDAQDGSGRPYAIGNLEAAAIHPSSADAAGDISTARKASEPALLAPSHLRRVQEQAMRLEALRSTMQDPAQTAAPELALLSTTCVRWRGEEDAAGAVERLAAATGSVSALADGIRIELSSEYNLVSKSLRVPITVTNDLDSPVTVRLVARTDKNIVRLPRDGVSLEIPANGQATASLPVEAIANGTVTMTVVLETADGARLTEPQEVRLTVNPAWENWTTLVIVVLMGLLVVVGVLRARRTGSDRRAPASIGPEDPATLAETGISAPYQEDEQADDDPARPADEQQDEQQDDGRGGNAAPHGSKEHTTHEHDVHQHDAREGRVQPPAEDGSRGPGRGEQA